MLLHPAPPDHVGHGAFSEPFWRLSVPRITLTDAPVRALKPTGKPESYWCTLTPNFGLRLSQRGGKSFFVMVGRQRKRIHLGKYPETSLKQARERARELLLNPTTNLNSKTLGDTFDAYFQTAVQPNCRNSFLYPDPDPQTYPDAENARRQSRRHYGRPRPAVEREVERIFQGKTV